MNPNLPRARDDDDRIYRTTNGGQTWTDISPKSHRDSSASPYVPWAGVYDATVPKPEASVGWWIDALAIDPFDSKHVCYATGATIWNTVDMNNADSGGDTHWTIWADGIEETAIANLISPPGGAHLISGFGDISGFTHDDLDVSPAARAEFAPAVRQQLMAGFRRQESQRRRPHGKPAVSPSQRGHDGVFLGRRTQLEALLVRRSGCRRRQAGRRRRRRWRRQGDSVGGWLGFHEHGRNPANLH